MRKRKNTVLELVRDAALVATLTLINRCFDNKEQVSVKRDVSEKQLSRKLTLVSLIYHAIGIFYNE